MPVNIIDTLKPKNNGSFPVVEAADVSVSEELRLPEALAAKADVSALAATDAAVATKANAADVSTATANLQGQINQIEISASAEAVVAPEVAAARVGADSTSYETLKERLDTENTDLNDKISNLEEKTDVYDKVSGSIAYLRTDNLCDPTTAVTGYYSDAKYNHVGDQLVIKPNSAFAYTRIEVENGKTYTVSRSDHNMLIVDDSGIVLQIVSSGTTTITVNTATAKYLYCSFRTANISINEFMIVEGSSLPESFIPYWDNVGFIYPSIYAEESEIITLESRISTTEEATGILSYSRTLNLCDPTTTVAGYYVDAKYDRIGDQMVEKPNASFAYAKIEVENGKTYTVSRNDHKLLIVDASGIVLQQETPGTTTITVNNATAKYLYCDFRTSYVSTDKFMIVEGSSLPESFLPYYTNVGFRYRTKYDGIEYIVDINGNGDYTSLTECLKDLKNNEEKKTIKILSGTYDVFEEYGGAAFISEVDISLGWRANSVFVPKNTHIIGIGKVVLKWDPSAEDIIDDAHANLFSPLNLSDDNIIIENVEIVCGNGRYCIHDECGVRWESSTAKFQRSTHKFINVTAKRIARTYGNVQAYGGGSGAECTYIFDNCIFTSTTSNVWSTHTNSDNTQGTGGCTFTFNNCIFDTDTPSGGTVRFINGEYFKNKNDVHFNSCYVNGDIKILYSGTEVSDERVQTYAITSLKTTFNDIIIDGDYGSTPYTPVIYN